MNILLVIDESNTFFLLFHPLTLPPKLTYKFTPQKYIQLHSNTDSAAFHRVIGEQQIHKIRLSNHLKIQNPFVFYPNISSEKKRNYIPKIR